MAVAQGQFTIFDQEDGLSFRTFTSAVKNTEGNIIQSPQHFSQTELNNLLGMGTKQQKWTVAEELGNLKVNDTVLIICYNSDKAGEVCIIGTVSAITRTETSEEFEVSSMSLLDKGDKGEQGPDGIYIKTIIEQYYLSGSVNATEPKKDANGKDITSVTITVTINGISQDQIIDVGQWIDIVDNSKIPIVKGYYRFRRQKYIWSNHVEGTVQGQDGYNITYSVARLDETDQRIVDWCSANNSTFIDGGHIYAHSISTAQLATNAITSIGDANGQGKYSYTEGNYSNAGSKFDLESGNIITPKFSVIDGSAYIDGNVTASAGSIGGWTIDEKIIQSTNEKAGLYSGDEADDSDIYSFQSLVKDGKSPVRFFCGGTLDSLKKNGSEPLAFMVLEDGSLYATAAYFSGANVYFDSNTTITGNGDNDPQTLGELNNIIINLRSEVANLEQRVNELNETEGAAVAEQSASELTELSDSAESEEPVFMVLEDGSLYATAAKFTGRKVSISNDTTINMGGGNSTSFGEMNQNLSGLTPKIEELDRLVTELEKDPDDKPPYTITFIYTNDSGPQKETRETDNQGYISYFKFPNPTRELLAFNGWYTSSEGGTEINRYTQFSKNTTVYAQWINRYIITFDSNGGSFENSNSQQIKIATGKKYRLSRQPQAVYKSDYMFKGWFTDPKGGDKIDPRGYQFKSDLNLYAHWEQGNIYTITFDGNGGYPNYQYIQTDKSQTLPKLPEDPTWGDCQFMGWYTDLDPDMGERIDKNYIFKGNTTVYAYWKFSVKFFEIDASSGNYFNSISDAQYTYTTTIWTEINGYLNEEIYPNYLSIWTEEEQEYRFRGWAIAKGRYIMAWDGSEESKDFATKFKGPTSLYAYYSLEVDKNQDNLYDDGGDQLVNENLVAAIEASYVQEEFWPDIGPGNMYCSQRLRNTDMSRWEYIDLENWQPIVGLTVPSIYTAFLPVSPDGIEIIYLNYGYGDYSGTRICYQHSMGVNRSPKVIFVLPPTTNSIGNESFIYDARMSIWYHSSDETKFGDRFLGDDNIQWIVIPNPQFPPEEGASITVTSFNDYGTFIAEEIFVYDGTSFNLQKEEDEEEY